MQMLKRGKTTVLAPELKRFAFLQDLPSDALEELAAIADFHELPRGFRLAVEGERADSFYIMDQGCVAVSMRLDIGTEAVNQRLGPQEISGWSWAVPPYTWDFNLTALEPSRVLAFPAEELRRVCDRDTDLGYALMKKIIVVSAARLRDSRRQLYGRRNTRPSRGVEL